LSRKKGSNVGYHGSLGGLAAVTERWHGTAILCGRQGGLSVHGVEAATAVTCL